MRTTHTLLLAGTLLVGGGLTRTALAHSRLIPAFARRYRTGCTTCHTAAPKLNVMGEAFRLNGYRLPDSVAAISRRDPPVPLGEEPWKDLWPRAVWPGELPASAPIAVRAQSDVLYARTAHGEQPLRLLMPEDFYLLAGANLGSNLSAFAELEWEHDGSVELRQAKILIQDPIPWLPPRSFNLLVGRQDTHLLTFADRILDRSGRRAFAWQEYQTSELTRGEVAGSGSWRAEDPMAALTINGLMRGRLFYSAGIAQQATEDDDDAGRPSSAFITLRYKLGGLRLDGAYDPGGAPRPRGHGQLLDRALIFEGFGLGGSEGGEAGLAVRQRAVGMAVRALNGPLDVGVGAVRRRDRDVWTHGGDVTASSVFAKGEYLVFPWLIGSLKVERFRLGGGVVDVVPDETTLVPGLVTLVRQNVRLAVEGELYARHRPSDAAGTRRPLALTTRLDIAF